MLSDGVMEHRWRMGKNLTLRNAVRQLGLDDNERICIVTGKKAVNTTAGNIPGIYMQKKCEGIRKTNGQYVFLTT